MKLALLAALVLTAIPPPACAYMTCRSDGLGGMKCHENDGVERVLRQADRLLDQPRYKGGWMYKAAAPGTGRHAKERRARERHKSELEEHRLRLEQLHLELPR